MQEAQKWYISSVSGNKSITMRTRTEKSDTV